MPVSECLDWGKIPRRVLKPEQQFVGHQGHPSTSRVSIAKNIYIRRVARFELKSSPPLCQCQRFCWMGVWWLVGAFILDGFFAMAKWAACGGLTGRKATSGSHISTVTNLFTLNWSTLTTDQEHQEKFPQMVDSTKLRIVWRFTCCCPKMYATLLSLHIHRDSRWKALVNNYIPNFIFIESSLKYNLLII